MRKSTTVNVFTIKRWLIITGYTVLNACRLIIANPQQFYGPWAQCMERGPTNPATDAISNRAHTQRQQGAACQVSGAMPCLFYTAVLGITLWLSYQSHWSSVYSMFRVIHLNFYMWQLYLTSHSHTAADIGLYKQPCFLSAIVNCFTDVAEHFFFI